MVSGPITDGTERFFETSSLKPLPKAERRPFEVHNPLEKCNDVPGTKPRTIPFQHSEREPVEGSSPKRSYKTPRNKPSYILRNDDIDSSSPSYDGFSTKRCSNPLSPTYSLASYHLEDLEPPRFLRDSMKISDIPGTCSKTYSRQLNISRATNFVGDVEGASPCIKYLKLSADYQPSHSSLHVRDITDAAFRTTRRTDTLSPRYRYNVPSPEFFMKNKTEFTRENWVIGGMTGNHPAVCPPLRSDEYMLRTDDIEGCHPRLPLVRREWRLTNDASDIEGTRPRVSVGARRAIDLHRKLDSSLQTSLTQSPVGISTPPPAPSRRSSGGNTPQNFSSSSPALSPSQHRSRLPSIDIENGRRSRSLTSSPSAFLATRSPSKTINHQLLHAFSNLDSN